MRVLGALEGPKVTKNQYTTVRMKGLGGLWLLLFTQLKRKHGFLQEMQV